MRIIAAIVAAGLATAFVADAGAAERTSKKRVKAYQQTQAYRSTTTDYRGLCQRDTGKPTSELNFRDKCDVEEFWTRMDRGGGNRRR